LQRLACPLVSGRLPRNSLRPQIADNPTAFHLRAINTLYEGLKQNSTIVIVSSTAAESMQFAKGQRDSLSRCPASVKMSPIHGHEVDGAGLAVAGVVAKSAGEEFNVFLKRHLSPRSTP